MKKTLLLLLTFSFCTTSYFATNSNVVIEDDQVEQYDHYDDDDFAMNDSEAEEGNKFVPPSFKHAFTKMMIALVVLVILVALTFWSLKRLNRAKFHQANNTQSIKIIEKRIISPKSILYLVEVENEKVLIAESHLEVRPIQKLTKSTIEDI
jgi:flagellar biogenesis protein FliO